jgi:hypothetical protein
MQTQQKQNNDVWPFAFVNGERTQASQELMDSKQYNTKDVFCTDDYEEATF